MMNENALTYRIRGCIYEVHKELGPGLLEVIYHQALYKELLRNGLAVKSEVTIPVVYKGDVLDHVLRLDLLVEDAIILELKSVEMLTDLHKKQLLTYLKITGKKVGLLVNFNSTDMNKSSIIRVVNGL